MTKEIIYAGDPLCAWCFGFTGVYSSIQKKFQDSVTFSYLMGGLKVGSSIPITAQIKDRLKDGWTTVAQRTGQTIAVERIDELPEGDYSSEAPCRAVVAVRSLDHDLGFAYYKSIHRAFYLDMKNINDLECLCELAENLGVDESTFFERYRSEDVKEDTFKDFDQSKKAGVLGLPALILKDENGSRVLNQGFKPLAPLSEAIEGWLNGKAAPLLF